MKMKINSIILIFTVFLLSMGCSTSRKGSGYLKVDIEAKNTELQINLGYPINTATDNELRKAYYADSRYFLRQKKDNQFKDNAPFIEILDGGKRERLWFTSSRADSLYRNTALTNLYQQVYYCEREIGNGRYPREGWGGPVRFSLKYDKPQLKDYIEGFNVATKGTVTVGGGTMILSCDQWNQTEDWKSIRLSLRNLWEVDLKTYPYAYPVQIDELSNPGTWESQPTLSANGKHLFFVSNRYVDRKTLAVSNDSTSSDVNIYYSFKEENGKWRAPVLVKELYSTWNEVSPQISVKDNKLYFSSDRSSDYEIYEIGLILDDVNGGYNLDITSLKLFDEPLFDLSSGAEPTEFHVNGIYNQKYPFYYYNPVNRKSPQAFFWASDNTKGLGSYDIYACTLPFNVTLNVVVADLCPQGGNQHVLKPVVELSGAKKQYVENESAQFALYSGLTYQLSGGSVASPENGTYSCDIDPSYIFVGYSNPDRINPCNKQLHSKIISGSAVLSEITRAKGKIQITGIVRDTTIFDTIYVTKAWEKKPPCPGKLNIEPTYRSIAYFQTGYWEVNTTANLKRDMAKLHEGFDVTPDNDIYNPVGKIIRNRSDYYTVGYDAPTYPVKLADHYTYSIANAPWIELHPNNQYWGDRPNYESRLAERMKGRKERIAQYVDYAEKVDQNLKNLTDTIKNRYIQLLDLHKDLKPKLLIEIFETEVTGIHFVVHQLLRHVCCAVIGRQKKQVVIFSVRFIQCTNQLRQVAV